MAKSRYIMIGGFLGAGKTTSINRFAESLVSDGLRVGLITNDQGAGLVDTAIGKSNAFPVEEISGGCFCCRFSSLVEAAQKLHDSPDRPDVFLAEPVGSCTDLVATVSVPLQKIYGEAYAVSPLSVVVDPVRALRLFGLEGEKRFSPNVVYIYRKQLEEAEFIVINKTDLVGSEQLDRLRSFFAREFPDATVFAISARKESGLNPWFDAVMAAEMDLPRFLDIDYDRYGEGEAELGWLNATLAVSVGDRDGIDGNAFLVSLAQAIQTSVTAAGGEVAHLKMTLTPEGDPFELAAVNLVRNDGVPELSHHLSEPLEDGEVLVNIRAEASPEQLAVALDTATSTAGDASGVTCTESHREHFRPGIPQPTHRFSPEEGVETSCPS